jgi:hypothetical protein
MIICPECSTELENDIYVCTNCGNEIDLTQAQGKHFPWVLVYTTNTEYDAQMFKANLEGAGIPTQILSQLDSSRMFTIGELAIVKIYVLSPYATEAKEIIQEIEKNNI